MFKADLHSHSTYSDGRLSVKELLDRAKKNGINVLGLTDHDSTFGVEEAHKYGKEIGIYVLKGLELSTRYKGQNCHLVCYFENNEVPQEMMEFSQNIIDTRNARAVKMMNLIHEIYGANIDLDDLFKGGTIITRGNMYRSLLKSNPNLDPEVVSSFVANDSKAFIPASEMTPQDGIKMIKKHKSIIILAHPTLMDYENVCDVVKMGIDGIEARYPLNKEGEEAKFRQLAKENNLFVSAGSDFHGDTKHAEVGTSTLEKDEFDIIAKRLNINYENN